MPEKWKDIRSATFPIIKESYIFRKQDETSITLVDIYSLMSDIHTNGGVWKNNISLWFLSVQQPQFILRDCGPVKWGAALREIRTKNEEETALILRAARNWVKYA